MLLLFLSLFLWHNCSPYRTLANFQPPFQPAAWTERGAAAESLLKSLELNTLSDAYRPRFFCMLVEYHSLLFCGNYRVVLTLILSGNNEPTVMSPKPVIFQTYSKYAHCLIILFFSLQQFQPDYGPYRLASPFSELEHSYDVIVIGSGYGGSIAASRAARAGRTVCLLEKGKEWRPGDFPEKEFNAVKELQMTVHNEKKGIGRSPSHAIPFYLRECWLIIGPTKKGCLQPRQALES